MEFFKKRSTAWTLFAITVVICLFTGRANKPKTDGSSIEVLPSGVYVQDNANILSDATEKYITKLNNGLASKVGAEIQVITIDTTAGENIYDVALNYGDDFSPVNERDISTVFVIAVDDYNAMIVQGNRLYNAPKSLFTDSNLDMIVENNFTVNDFDRKDLDGDIKDSFDDIISLYESYYSVSIPQMDNIQREYTQTTDSFRVMLFAFVIFMIIILIITVMLTRPRRRVIRPIVTTGRTTGRGYYPPRNTYTTPPRNNHTSGGFSGGRSSSTSNRGGFSGGRTNSFSGGRSSSTSSRSGFSGSSFSGGRSSSSFGRSGFSGSRSSGGRSGFSGRK